MQDTPLGLEALCASDLAVAKLSDALSGKKLDVIVSGSIGALEAVRFVRALRRLGAEVQGWLTPGGAQFITPLALGWACAKPVRTDFAADASHIAVADACVIAPASASFMGKLANGITDSPATAVATSHLGQGKPVFLLPNMHESLSAAPSVAANERRLSELGVSILGARMEEGKRKFPAPDTLADEVSHRINRALSKQEKSSILITMGSTRGYIDAVRYLSNYSSGALGSAISEELYRYGFETLVVCGACSITPRVYSQFVREETNDGMLAAAQEFVSIKRPQGAIFVASVLDYVPERLEDGKLRSNLPELTIRCKPTQKLIAAITPHGPVKVGFKLETSLTLEKAEKLAKDYQEKYGLSAMLINDLADIDHKRHRAWVMESSNSASPALLLESKRSIAAKITQHVLERLS